jgi:hypothetical protein
VLSRLWWPLTRFKQWLNPNSTYFGAPDVRVCGICNQTKVRFAVGVILCLKCDP